jgi:hypothetical protein
VKKVASRPAPRSLDRSGGLPSSLESATRASDAKPFPGVPKPIPDATVERVISIIDSSGVEVQLSTWKEEDRRGPGGRPETFPTKAILVAMLLCAYLHEPMLATQFTDVLFRRISPTMRRQLGIPEPPGALDHKSWDALYRNVRTRLHGILQLMDPSPNPKNRRLPDDLFLAEVELRRGNRHEAEWSTRYERLEWFVNAIIEASLSVLPRRCRRAWKGSVAIDATVIPAFARPDRRARRRAKSKPSRVLVHSADPDADWYVRGDQEDDEAGASGKSIWGYEATLVVSGTDDPSGPQVIPSLVMGMAVLHKPGSQPGTNATHALRSVRDRGNPANFLAGDRAYTNAKPEDFQLPARALGYRPVLDYKVDQLGIQDQFVGTLQIDGAFYCPAIPKVLIAATADFRDGTIDEETYRARLKERCKYLIVSKSAPDEEGHLRVRCPASNPAPTARCELKPRSVTRRTTGRLRVVVPADLEARPPPICSQQSVTVPPHVGAKYAQDLLYGSPEWEATYATLRSSIEGFNGFVKDGAHEALDDPERRRIRGVAAQSVLVAFLLAAANLRKIATFNCEEKALASGKLKRLPKRRRTKSIDTWRPETPAVALASDPDPPTGIDLTDCC